MIDDPLAELKRIGERAGWQMKLTTAVVLADKPQQLAAHYEKMTDDELEEAFKVFCDLSRAATDALERRNVKKTPNEWQHDKSIDRMVVTPYGWTRPGGTYKPQAWDVPVSRKEFLDRMGMSGSMLKEHGTKDFAYMGEIA